jgi:hypothetical protein
MPVAPKDPRWKQAAGEIKSQEVLDLNEDLNIIVSKMKGVDANLAKVYGKIRDDQGSPDVEDSEAPKWHTHVSKLGKALRAVRTAYEEVEKASNLLNEAAQYFDSP